VPSNYDDAQHYAQRKLTTLISLVSLQTSTLFFLTHFLPPFCLALKIFIKIIMLGQEEEE
jgi:hypothetical protein